jgi:hypothetical protein
MMTRMLRRALLGLVAATAAYLVLLAYPQPLFAYELTHAGLTVHADAPIPEAMRGTLERVRSRLDRSPLDDRAWTPRIFICNAPWRFALFARQHYGVGGVADGFVGQHVFLRASDMHNDRLMGPSGQPVAADRPLSYFIAHELMHIATVRHVGRARYARLPQWVDDGYADYVAKDIDLTAALAAFKDGTRELDPARSGLYLRYHLMVAYLLEKKAVSIASLMARPPERDALERELHALTEWP